ncbi:hemerythrin domain-containing protein [Candidatus Parcubacteria bacterium]|nr:MAG: hemerythrin domain-containing protein [Candidatus Parcubacteria bacterium]
MAQNPIDMIVADHRTVERLFAEYQHAAAAERRSIAERLFGALEAHARMEEQVFYPAVADQKERAATDRVAEAQREHGDIKLMIAELRNRAPGAAFDERMANLKEAVEHHVKEEETELLPYAAERLSGHENAIAREMERVKMSIAHADERGIA